MIHKQHYDFYIASCDKNGGIYQYRLYLDGSVEFIAQTPLDRPMYMTIHENKIHVILRSPYLNSDESAYLNFDLGQDGRLINPSKMQSTKGVVACHLAVNEAVYCVNYLSGDIIKLPDTKISHQGHSIHPVRQASAHPHQAVFTPDNKYICIVDLGMDQIVTYDKNLQFISSAEVEKGHGARHLLFSPDGRYAFCANELASTVTAFRYADGMLRKLETVHTLPQPYKGESSVAAIRITSDGKNLYVSNRGHDSISCFLVNEGSLTLTEVVNCGGMSPRDFNITPDGRFLLCANENSDTVTIFKMNDGKLIKTHIELTLKSPLCVIFN